MGQTLFLPSQAFSYGNKQLPDPGGLHQQTFLSRNTTGEQWMGHGSARGCGRTLGWYLPCFSGKEWLPLFLIFTAWCNQTFTQTSRGGPRQMTPREGTALTQGRPRVSINDSLQFAFCMSSGIKNSDLGHGGSRSQVGYKYTQRF